MSKPTNEMQYLIAIGSGIISTGILIINFFGSPVSKVDAKVDNIASVVSELKSKTSGDISEIKANVQTLTDGQKETRADIKSILLEVKKR